jgi:fibro-slime domain-containing protein
MKSQLSNHLLFLLASGAVGVACGGGDENGGKLDDTGGSGGKGVIAVGGKSTIPSSGGSSGTAPGGNSGGSANTGNTGPYMLPQGYTSADDGGFQLGDAVTKDNKPDLGGDGEMSCGTTILGIVRDFKRGDQGGHPDFETFTGKGQPGIVLTDLGKDNKPAYNEKAAATYPTGQGCDHDGDKNVACTTTKANFDQWYNDVPGTNDPFYIFFSLEPGDDGLARFTSRAFFPLDGEGFGNQSASHNFGFTTEVHTTFRYNGKERFKFTGDDDLWVFINKKLAIDLGGLHESKSQEILLDDQAKALGITPGNIYQLDLFHAERHSSQSNFNIISNLNFVDCGVIVPSGPVK